MLEILRRVQILQYAFIGDTNLQDRCIVTAEQGAQSTPAVMGADGRLQRPMNQWWVPPPITEYRIGHRGRVPVEGFHQHGQGVGANQGNVHRMNEKGSNIRVKGVDAGQYGREHPLVMIRVVNDANRLVGQRRPNRLRTKAGYHPDVRHAGVAVKGHHPVENRHTIQLQQGFEFSHTPGITGGKDEGGCFSRGGHGGTISG